MRSYLFLFLTACFISCSPKLRLDSDQLEDIFTDGNFAKVAVIGIGNDIKARKEFEKTAVELFNKKGVNAIEGISIFPQDTTSNELTTDELIGIIRKNNVEAILTMELIRVDSLTAEDRKLSTGVKVLSVMLALVSSSGNPDYQPGPANSYMIESVLYDLRGELFEGKETLVWKGECSIPDPPSLKSIANTFSKKLVSHTVKEKIITGR